MTESVGTEALANIRLEDSYVLEVLIAPGAVTLRMDFVLAETHPNYSSPPPGEAFCFSPGLLRIDGPESVAWTMPTVRPAVDAAGEVDWGSLDEFEVGSDGFDMTGDFGHLHISEGVLLVLLEPVES